MQRISNTALEGGEIGSGHSLLAAFEISPVSSQSNINTAHAIASAELSYIIPGTDKPVKEHYFIPQNYIPLEKSDSCLRFATSVIMFGMMLKQSPFAKEISWDPIQTLASSSADKKNLLQTEFINLIAKAKKLYPVKKKKDE